MKSIKHLMMIILVLGLPKGAQSSTADGWCHLVFTTLEGAKVSFDYQVDYNGGIYTADPVWMKVNSPKFTGHERVSLIWMPWSFDQRGGDLSAVPTGEIMTANFKMERFTQMLLQGLRLNYEITGFIHEFAVVVNGVWLKNPQTGLSNFRVDLYRSHSEQGQCYR